MHEFNFFQFFSPDKPSSGKVVDISHAMSPPLYSFHYHLMLAYRCTHFLFYSEAGRLRAPHRTSPILYPGENFAQRQHRNQRGFLRGAIIAKNYPERCIRAALSVLMKRQPWHITVGFLLIVLSVTVYVM